MRKRLEQFDGLRTYAILLIMASHTKAYNLTNGQMMVALFFALGGFFAVRPYASDHKELTAVTKPMNWLVYYMHRAARILPAYWLTLMVCAYLDLFKGKSQDLSTLLDNLLFRNANGHFWYVQNLAVIYLFVPVLLLVGFFIKKLSKDKQWIDLFLGAFYILFGIVLHNYFRYVSGFYLLGNNNHQYLRIGIFCIGMGFGFFAKHLHGTVLKKGWQKALADVAALAIMIIAAVSSSYHLKAWGITQKGLNLGSKYPVACALVLGILFLLLFVNSDSLLSKVLGCKTLQAIGVSSYTIYLVQSIILRSLKSFETPEKKWLYVCIISISIGYACYNLLEKPIYDFVKSKIKAVDVPDRPVSKKHQKKLQRMKNR